MIPISACGNPPPERSRARESNLRLYRRRIRAVPGPRYNFGMRFCRAVFAILMLGWSAGAQEKGASAPQFVTVPLILDHNRVIIEASVLLSDGTGKRVHAWVDNGNPDLYISKRLATSMSCHGQICSGAPPVEMTIGGMTIPLGGRVPGSGIKEAKVPLTSDGATSIVPGMDAEINIPSTVLRHYDVLVDFPGHKFSIGAPGTTSTPYRLSTELNDLPEANTSSSLPT